MKRIEHRYNDVVISKTEWAIKGRDILLSVVKNIVKTNWGKQLESTNKNSALDIGFGPGLFIEAYKDMGFKQVTGIDRSNDCVEKAKNNVKKEGIDFICSDANEYLEKTSGKYSLISAFHVIEHMDTEYLNRFIELTYGRLENGGMLLLETPNMNYLLANYHRYGDITHKNGFTANSLTQLLEGYGFKQVIAGEKNVQAMSLFHVIRKILGESIVRSIYKAAILFLEGFEELKARRGIFSTYFWVIGKKNEE
ncbi:MAG: class I SAM-dependent methyltransferase [Endomicrobiales bacterium]|nr:class I SAM-dependent methyltransferase [Endomicrobiales bacterium]